MDNIHHLLQPQRILQTMEVQQTLLRTQLQTHLHTHLQTLIRVLPPQILPLIVQPIRLQRQRQTSPVAQQTRSPFQLAVISRAIRACLTLQVTFQLQRPSSQAAQSPRPPVQQHLRLLTLLAV